MKPSRNLQETIPLFYFPFSKILKISPDKLGQELGEALLSVKSQLVFRIIM